MSGRPGSLELESPSTRRRVPGASVLLAAALLPLTACKGDRIVIAGQSPPVLSELVDPDAGSARDGGGAPGGIGTPARCPSSPAQRRQVLGCWPTRQVGRWQGYWLGVPRYETDDGALLEFPPGDVVMRFGDDGAGTFGVGTPAGGVAVCASGSDAGSCGQIGEVRPGFEYHIEQVLLEDAGQRGTPRVAGEAPPRAGELMQFSIRLGEPWDPTCQGAPAECRGPVCPAVQTGDQTMLAPTGVEAGTPCRCGVDRCVYEAATLAVSLTMSADGRALRGAYAPRSARLPPVGLELVRVEGP